MPLSDRTATLGVTVDSSLTFRHHVSNACRSAHFNLQALRHIRGTLAYAPVTTTIRLPFDGRSTAYKRSLRSQ